MKDFWNNVPKPIVALAPMDGYTDSAFRRVVKAINPSVVVFTEFTSSDGFHFAREKMAERFHFSPDEQPIVAQIFGNDPSNFVEAAQYCEALGFRGVDINMGCPAKRVVKSEQGVALRASHDKAFRIVDAVARATALPVSVKTRLGMTDASDLLSFGKGLESAGANLVTIHGRTYADPYGCPANFQPIYELQASVAIPVIGNGGIRSLADGRATLGNLAGFMIGQAALGNPWVFSESGAPPFALRVGHILQHLAWLSELKGLARAQREARKHLLAYVKGIPDAASYRSRLARISSMDEARVILDDIVAERTPVSPAERPLPVSA